MAKEGVYRVHTGFVWSWARTICCTGLEKMWLVVQAAGGFRVVAKQLNLQYMPTRKGQ